MILTELIQFVIHKTYRELYCDKPVDMHTLDRMIGNLTLNLDKNDMATMGAPNYMNKEQEVLEKDPRGKTPGPDSLPYKIYRALPGLAATAIAEIANLVTEMESQPDSWLDISVAVLPKEEICTQHTNSAPYPYSTMTTK